MVNNKGFILETIAAMLWQEYNGYRTCDYLNQRQQKQHNNDANDLSRQHLQNGSLLTIAIDQDCRTKMADWCHRMVDRLQFPRETAAIAMNLLDRFVGTRVGFLAMCNATIYQLAAMTCLYTAIKVHAPEAIAPETVARISKGLYSPQEVEAMELVILQAVRWRVNPPTAMAFVRHCLALLILELPKQEAAKLDKYSQRRVLQLAALQTEWAVSDYDFVSVKSSVIAYGALMNVLTTLFGLSATRVHRILAYALQMQIDPASGPETAMVQTRLFSVLSTSVPRLHDSNTKRRTSTDGNKSATQRNDACHISPRSVFMGDV